MKKCLTSLSIIAFCTMALDISMLSVQNQRLKNRLADSNLAVDMATASVQEARKIQSEVQQALLGATETLKRSVDYIDQLRAELRHSSVTAVNEKQGAHTFVYVEADSWVDLSNGEKVPAMRKIAPPVDVDPNPLKRWPQDFRPAGYWRASNGSLVLDPGFNKELGTRGWSE